MIIKPHLDFGLYNQNHHRVQIDLGNGKLNDVDFIIDKDDYLVMDTAEAWCFDNQKIHTVLNKSQNVRYAIVVDVYKYE